MNCPTRDTEPSWNPEFNQSPPQFSNDLTTNGLFNNSGQKNSLVKTISTEESSSADQALQEKLENKHLDSAHGEKGVTYIPFNMTKISQPEDSNYDLEKNLAITSSRSIHGSYSGPGTATGDSPGETGNGAYPSLHISESSSSEQPPDQNKTSFQAMKNVLMKYLRFIGPGFMISVAYMDPGNYSTDVAAGAGYKFSLLFVILLSNCIAIFLQILCIKLGSVTGLDLAQCSRKHLPKWLTIILYLLAEAAIIATDIAEVIGTAIALNILLRIPLIAGVAITIFDVMIVLLAYRPGGSMKVVQAFEYGIAVLVLGVVVCFIIELTRIPSTPVGPIFRGYLPSSDLLKGNALYISCGILGATVMPHSLYLGSALVKPRLRDYDVRHGYPEMSGDDNFDKYVPSLASIKSTLRFSSIEVAVSLFTFALFVNSAILIVAGATLYGTEAAVDADLYSIHQILSTLLSGFAGTIFMLALLLSGQSAGLICTISGQIVSEGYLNWKFRPWIRRMITRTIAIMPCIIVAGAVGRAGLAQTLNASQVVLSILLPFLTAPLVYFTCMKRVMTVTTSTISNDGTLSHTTTDFSNNWLTKIFAVAIWIFICILNVYLIVQLGLGNG